MKKSGKKSEKKLKEVNVRTSIKTFFNTVVKNNIEDFKKNKKLEPHVIIITDKKKMLVAPLMDCKDSEERFSVLSEIGKKLSKNNIVVEAVISASESWMSVSKKSENLTMPSNDPQRKEILMFTAIDDSENAITTMYRIERKGEEVTLNSMKKEIDILDKWVENKDIFDNLLLGSFWHSYKS